MICPRCGANPQKASEEKGPVRKKSRTRARRARKARPEKSGGTLLKGPLFIVLLITAFSYYLLYHYSPEPEGEPEPNKGPAPSAAAKPQEVQRPNLRQRSRQGSDAAPAPQQNAARSRQASGTPPASQLAARKPLSLAAPNEGVAAFKEGDYPKAARIFRSALEASPGDATLKQNLARSLAGLGSMEFEKLNYAKSKEHFSEALGYELDPRFSKGLAASQVKLNELDAAARTLEAVKDDKSAAADLAVVYNTLGDRSHQSGDIDGAVSWYEKALELDSSAKHIQVKLDGMRGEQSAEEGFGEFQGSHFLVKFEGGENVVAGNLIVLLLEEAYLKIGAEIGYYPEDPLGAVLYSQKLFQDVTRSPSWAGAVFDGRIKLPAGGITERTDVLEKVLFHEYTHAVVHRLSNGKAPVWLNEGIAQYEEGKRVGSDKGALKQIAANNPVSLRALEGSFMSMSSEEADAAYLLSLSATEYIINEFGIFAVKRILNGLGEGKGLDKAISSSIYIPYDVLEESWLASLKR
jgi:tetratricopeptide (TPR) repeat protein